MIFVWLNLFIQLRKSISDMPNRSAEDGIAQSVDQRVCKSIKIAASATIEELAKMHAADAD